MTLGGSVAAQRPQLIGLQYLRAVAALQVVVEHAAAAAGVKLAFPSFGVPLFFVVSGFLMVAITDESSRPWPFFRDRLIRIVPLYWIATTAMAAALAARGGLDPVHTLASYLFVPYGVPGAEGHFLPVLGVGWTLNYEMMFYAIFALCLAFPRRALMPALTLLFLAIAAMAALVPPDQAPLGFWCNPLILQFLAGAWVGHVWARGGSLGAPIVLCVAASVILGLVGGVLRDTLWLGVQCTLLVIGVLELERAGAFRRVLRPLLFLGDASYSIYLWHVFAITAVSIAARPTGAPTWAILELGIAGGAAAGAASYVLLERPLLRAMRRPRFRHGVPVPAGP